MLEAVGLGGFGRRYPHQLSGGQQQRVALARALAIEPALVLLDEPFASLDAHLRASVRADVQEIFRRAGTTAVLVTHDQDEALSIADRVAALRDGQIAQYATPEDLYTRPVDADLATFIGEANLLEGVLNAGAVKTILGTLPLDDAAAVPDGQVTVLVRPEQIELASGGDGTPGRVTSYGYHGHDAVLHVQPEQTPRPGDHRPGHRRAPPAPWLARHPARPRPRVRLAEGLGEGVLPALSGTFAMACRSWKACACCLVG